VSKDIELVDENGEWHGYCERYHDDDSLMWKGLIIHGHWYGWHEEYDKSGDVFEEGTGYWLGGGEYEYRISADNEEGYCYIWNRSAHGV
jgi:hypothetical protein